MTDYFGEFCEYMTLFMQQHITLFLVACVFIVIDILSRLIVVLIYHDFSSTKLREGLGHKLGYIIIMCAVAVIQVAMFDDNFHVDFDFPLFGIVCGFIIFMEFTSILENACYLNPSLDKLIGKFFAQSNPIDDYYYDDMPYESDIDYTIKEDNAA